MMRLMIALALLMTLSVASAQTVIYEAEIKSELFGTFLVIRAEVPAIRELKVQVSDYPEFGYRSCRRVNRGPFEGTSTIRCDISTIGDDLEFGNTYRVRVTYIYPPVPGDRLRVETDAMSTTFLD